MQELSRYHEGWDFSLYANETSLRKSSSIGTTKLETRKTKPDETEKPIHKSWLRSLLPKFQYRLNGDRKHVFQGFNNVLDEIPSNWPHPVLGARYFNKLFARSKFMEVFTDPRLSRAVAFAVVSVPVYYISLFETSLGDTAYFTGIVYMVYSFLAPYGLGSLSSFAFTVSFLILAFSLCSLLLACVIAESNALLLFAYIANTLFWGTARAGKLGAMGRLIPMMVFIINTTLFWSLYPTAKDGLRAIIPMADATAFLEQVQSGGTTIDNATSALSEQLVLMMQANETSSVFVPIPASLNTPVTGMEVNMTVIPGDSISLYIAPGWWVITDILWGESNSAITSIGSFICQTAVGIAFYIAASFLFPPYYSIHREIRYVQGRALATCLSAYSLFYVENKKSLVVQDFSKARGSGDQLHGDMDDKEHSEAVDNMKRTGQALFEALNGTQMLIDMSKVLEPNWITPCVLSRIGNELDVVNERIIELCTELFLQTLYQVKDKGHYEECHDYEVDGALKNLKLACSTLVERCGYAICLVPYSGMRGKVEELSDELNDLERDVRAAYREYKRLYLTSLTRTLENVPGDQVDKLVLDSAVRQTQTAVCFRNHPVRLSESVRELLKAEFTYSLKNAVLSILLLLLGLTVAGFANIIKQCVMGIKTFITAEWKGEDAWYRNRALHSLLRYSFGLFILFIIPLYSEVYRTWVYPVKEDIATPTQYLTVPLSNKFEMWSVLSFVICLFHTVESTTHKAIARLVGITIGCLLTWFILWSAQDEAWAVVAWLSVMQFVTIFVAASPGSSSVLWVNPAWGYAAVSVQICITIICVEYWDVKEDYTIEYFVLSRFGGNYVGSLLAMFVSVVVFPESAGFSARIACLSTYKYLCLGLKTVINGVENTADSDSCKGSNSQETLNGSNTPSTKCDTKGLSSTSLEDNNGLKSSITTNTSLVSFVSPSFESGTTPVQTSTHTTGEKHEVFDSVNSMTHASNHEEVTKLLGQAGNHLELTQVLLRDASVMSRGPLVTTDGRLYELRVHFSTLHRMANVVNVVWDIADEGRMKSLKKITLMRDTTAEIKETANGDIGTNGDQYSQKETGTDEEVHAERMEVEYPEAERHGQLSRTSRSHSTAPLTHKHVVRIDEALKESAFRDLDELENLLRGILLSHSDMDVTDTPFLSMFCGLSDDIKAGDDEALDTLLRSNKEGKLKAVNEDVSTSTDDGGVKPQSLRKHTRCLNRGDELNSLLCLRIEREGDMTLRETIESVHSLEACAVVYYAISLARFQDYSRLVLESYKEKDPEDYIPHMQKLLTIRNARSRRFIMKMNNYRLENQIRPTNDLHE